MAIRNLPRTALLVAALTVGPRARATAPAADDPRLVVPAAERDAEAARLRALGLTVPDGGPVLERPWSPPFTRRSFVVPQRWFELPGPDARVEADALGKDLPILEALMRRAYGGWDSARARGWDWDGWFAGWRRALEARGGERLALADAFSPLRDLMGFQLDNHTNIPLSRSTSFGSGSQSVVIEGEPHGACTEVRTSDGRSWNLDPRDPAQRPRQAKRWDAARKRLEPVRYLTLPGSRGTPSAIRCGGAWLSTRQVWPGADSPLATKEEREARLAPILALARAAADEPRLELLDPAIAYLRLPTFTKRNAQLVEQHLPSWPKPTGRERVLVVDLRDNAGGDVAVEALAGWVDAKRLEPAFTTHRRQGASCLYPALRWGYAEVTTRGLQPPLGKDLTAQLQGALDALFLPSPGGCPPAFDARHGGWDYRRHRMRPPGPVDGRRRVLVLVNDGTGSDGELMAMLLASLPETVVAGSSTYGVAQFVQPGYSVLPHTRLPFRIALGTNDPYGDGRSFDGYGLDVDVLLATEADQSPASLLALARYVAGSP